MPQGRPLAPLTITDEQQEQLDGIARSDTLPYAWVVRVRMILACAEGLTTRRSEDRVARSGSAARPINSP